MKEPSEAEPEAPLHVHGELPLMRPLVFVTTRDNVCAIDINFPQVALKPTDLQLENVVVGVERFRTARKPRGAQVSRQQGLIISRSKFQ